MNKRKGQCHGCRYLSNESDPSIGLSNAWACDAVPQMEVINIAHFKGDEGHQDMWLQVEGWVEKMSLCVEQLAFALADDGKCPLWKE